MKPSITATLTVEVRDGRPSLIVGLPGADDDALRFNIPLTESAATIKKLVRELAGLIVANAHQQVGKITVALSGLDP